MFGKGESQISQACRGVVDGIAGASIHYQVKFPETLVKIVVRDSTTKETIDVSGDHEAQIRISRMDPTAVESFVIDDGNAA